MPLLRLGAIRMVGSSLLQVASRQPCRMDSDVGLTSVRYFVKAGGLIPMAQTSQNSFSKQLHTGSHPQR